MNLKSINTTMVSFKLTQKGASLIFQRALLSRDMKFENGQKKF